MTLYVLKKSIIFRRIFSIFCIIRITRWSKKNSLRFKVYLFVLEWRMIFCLSSRNVIRCFSHISQTLQKKSYDPNFFYDSVWMLVYDETSFSRAWESKRKKVNFDVNCRKLLVPFAIYDFNIPIRELNVFLVWGTNKSTEPFFFCFHFLYFEHEARSR